ncbi:putative cell wall associated hydrolase [Chlamydia psittaci 10_743_SC13]|nr:putative cell wall associated hydrolase [Chlamydia psittaci 10_743_SC13]
MFYLCIRLLFIIKNVLFYLLINEKLIRNQQMKESLKRINLQNSTATNTVDESSVSCSGDEVLVHQPWNIGNTTIKNIVRPTINESESLPNGCIVLKSDLSDYLQKGLVTTSGTYLRTIGGLMVGNIDMGNNKVSGLPTSYAEIQVDSKDIVSVGMVQEDIGAIADTVKILVRRMDEITDPQYGLDKLFTDLGSPGENGVLAHPNQAKWLIINGDNTMEGTLHFQKLEQTSLLGENPTITGLYIGNSSSSSGGNGSSGSGTLQAVGAISNETDADLLTRLVAVDDLTKTLEPVKNSTGTGTSTATYPQWTGMDVPFICLTSSNSSSTNPVKSKCADKFMTYTNEGQLTLLRRGLYFISFCFDFSSASSSDTSDSSATDVSCTLSLTPNGGSKTTVYTCSGKSDTTLTGQCYLFAEGDTPSVSTTLSIEVTPTPVSKKMWAISFRACY